MILKKCSYGTGFSKHQNNLKTVSCQHYFRSVPEISVQHGGQQSPPVECARNCHPCSVKSRNVSGKGRRQLSTSLSVSLLLLFLQTPLINIQTFRFACGPQHGTHCTPTGEHTHTDCPTSLSQIFLSFFHRFPAFLIELFVRFQEESPLSCNE